MRRPARPPAAWALAALAVGSGMALPARAEPVVVLQSAALAPYDSAVAGFRHAWGETVTVLLVQGSDPAGLATRLARARPEVVVALGPRAAAFVRDHLPRVPLVHAMIPRRALAELGGAWVTGIGTDVPERTELEALRTAAPDVTRLGVIVGPGADPVFATAAREAAVASGMILVERTVADRSALPAAARDLVAAVDALWLPADPSIASPETFQFLRELSLRQRKPLLVFSESLVRAGAFVAVVPDYGWVGEKLAEIVRRIRAGERAGDIRMMPLRRTRVVVNEATARALGRSVPGAAVERVEAAR